MHKSCRNSLFTHRSRSFSLFVKEILYPGEGVVAGIVGPHSSIHVVVQRFKVDRSSAGVPSHFPDQLWGTEDEIVECASLVPRTSHPSVCHALVLQATNGGVRRPGNEAQDFSPQRLSRVSTTSDKHWSEKAWERG